MSQKLIQKQDNKKLFVLFIFTTFVLFVFTNDGHRYTFDEDIAQVQTKRIVSEQPNPQFEPGISRSMYLYCSFTDCSEAVICRSEVLCSAVFIGHTITQVPFLFINHYFDIITENTLILTNEDFDDPHYVFWRNSLDPDFTFLELFYGSFFSSLSVGVFYLTSRQLHYRQKTSVVLAFIFAVSTPLWAYSQTSFNLIPNSFFVLLGIFFFVRYFQNNSIISLIFCALSIGFAFMTRNDAAIAAIVIFSFLIFSLMKKNKKLRKFTGFVIPALSVFILDRLIDFIRFIPGTSRTTPTIIGGSYLPPHPFPIHIGISGLLFSPGLGIFIFYPILVTCFMSFMDFFRKNKFICLFFITLILGYLIFYATIPNWHGMSAWAARYMLPTIPLFLLPLGASIEKRSKLLIVPLVLVLGGLGVLSNLVYVIQDENWFIWGIWGSERGLTSLGSGLDIHPATFWTFEYSQLTHSILTVFTHLQLDIYLLKLFGMSVYLILLLGILIPLGYLIVKVLKTDSRRELLNKNTKYS